MENNDENEINAQNAYCELLIIDSNCKLKYNEEVSDSTMFNITYYLGSLIQSKHYQTYLSNL